MPAPVFVALPAVGETSLSATLAGRVNFAALLLCLVFVIVSYSHAPSAAFRLVLESCVMRVPTRQSITSAKDLCIVRSVDYPRLSVVARRNVVPPSGCRRHIVASPGESLIVGLTCKRRLSSLTSTNLPA